CSVSMTWASASMIAMTMDLLVDCCFAKQLVKPRQLRCQTKANLDYWDLGLAVHIVTRTSSPRHAGENPASKERADTQVRPYGENPGFPRARE
ncbi:MAG: hypothetical protein ACXWXT_04350, partial [Candidatus Binatia bacterium]